MLDGHAGSAIKVLVAIQYSVVVARNGYPVHNKCSGIKGSMSKVAIICRGCLNPVTSNVM